LINKIPEYIFAHFAAKGCIYDSGLTAPKGWDFCYKPGEIKRWFVGDIHLRQSLAPNASYPGSPIQIHFGESGSKGFDIYDCESGKLEQVILTKTMPMVTEIIKDKLIDFNPNVLYRIYASNDFLKYNYPINVIDLKPLGSKKKEDEEKRVEVQEEIDFGDPLIGLEDTLKRTKLPESWYRDVREVAMEIMR
jgi:DNA repair exonuclease SbcCD nuclease subunit